MRLTKRHIILKNSWKGKWVLTGINFHLQPKLKKEGICSFTVFFYLFILLCGNGNLYAQNNSRQEISLDKNWRSVEDDHNKNAFDGFENPSLTTKHGRK